jgi:acyl-coenzyme A synthetase/AMP-(fatty) acid ligase
MVMEDRFHAEAYWETIEKYKITQDHWTGTVPINLMKMPKAEFESRVSLKILGTFGALYETMKERWPNLSFQSLFGQTEHPFITAVPPDQIYPKFPSPSFRGRGSNTPGAMPARIEIVADGVGQRDGQVADVRAALAHLAIFQTDAHPGQLVEQLVRSEHKTTMEE